MQCVSITRRFKNKFFGKRRTLRIRLDIEVECNEEDIAAHSVAMALKHLSEDKKFIDGVGPDLKRWNYVVCP